LRKLDLTINFVDLDELKSSMDHLSDRKNLVDLYMMGNPCQASWDKFNNYVIGKLPQLTTLDGTEITRSMQIQARQMLPKLEVCLEN
jgi:protein TilB